jgi:uncharacterized protein HemX
MKTTKMTQMMILLVIAAIAVLALGAVAYAAPQPATESLKANVAQSAKLHASDTAVLGQADPAGTDAASDPTDGDLGSEPEADAPDTPHDGTEGDGPEAVPAGEPTTMPLEPAPHAEEETQPPISVLVTESVPPTRSVETTPPPHRHTYRRHLAFTGGDQVLYLIAGALIIAAAGAVLLIGRARKQNREF